MLIDDKGEAQVCDFGLSRVMRDTTSPIASRETRGEDVIIGSRNWMSPEVLLGGIARMPSDIYSFGMTIYEAREIPYNIIDILKMLITDIADIYGHYTTRQHSLHRVY